MSERYTDQSYLARKALAKFLDEYEHETHQTKGQSMEAFYNSHLEKPECETLDLHRKHFVAYFTKLFDLHKAGLVRDEEMKGFANKDELAILFKVVKPMEKVIKSALVKLDPTEESSTKPDPLFEFYERLHARGFIE